MAMTLEQQRALAVAQAARKRAEAEREAGLDPVNPDGTYGQPPPEMYQTPGGYMLDTEAVARKQAREGGVAEYLGNIGAQAVSNFPFLGSYFDEAVGAGGEIFGHGQDYSTKLARSKLKTFDEDNKKAATTAQVGGMLSTLPALIASTPSALMSLVPRSLGGRVLAGGAAGGAGGALEGAIYGSGEGTDPQSRRQRAKEGALLGGGIGLGLGVGMPAVAAGARPAINRVADYLSFGRAARQAGIDRTSQDILSRSMAADASLTGQGAQNIARMGNDAMLADAGPSAQSLLDLAVQRSGRAGNIAREAVEARASRANTRINQALDTALGAPQGVRSTERAIREGSQPARSAAYGRAYEQPIDYATEKGKSLERLYRRVPADAINRANRLMSLEGEQSNQILARVADDGSITYERLPDVMQLDYITRALNDMAQAGDGAGALGGQTGLGRAYQNLSRDIRNLTGDLAPEYRTALNTAAEPIAERQALLTGQDMFKPSMTRDDVAMALEGMTDAELRMARTGLRSSIDDALANVKRAVTDGNMDAREAVKAIKDMSSRANREKVSMLIGENQASALFNEMDRAAAALDLRAAIAQNSRTYARQSASERISDQLEGGPLAQLMEGRPINATQEAAKVLSGRTAAEKLAKEDQTYENMARILTQSDPSTALSILSSVARRSPENEALARRLANRAGLSLGALGYQTGMQLGGTR